MRRLLLRARALLRDALKPLGEAIVGALTVALLKATRRFDPIGTANLFGAVARRIGPWMRENRIGRDNLTKAFPEKSPAEIETILGGVWDNLGRLAAEFAHLDRIWDVDVDRPDKVGRVAFDARSRALFEKLRDDGKPALIFAAHLGNWELPALAAAAHGLDAAVLFRRPNIAAADQAIQSIRTVNMGTMIAAGRDAPIRLANALQNGRHVAMLVDQYLTKGVDVTFFGRTTKANPMLARLARQIDCPIHGTRIVRLPGHTFRAELTEEIPPVRDASGQIDVQATTQRINDIIEGWVREHPEQWLWLHRRWR